MINLCRFKCIYSPSLLVVDLIFLIALCNIGYGSYIIHLARTVSYDTCTLHKEMYKSGLAIGIINIIWGLIFAHGMLFNARPILIKSMGAGRLTLLSATDSTNNEIDNVMAGYIFGYGAFGAWTTLFIIIATGSLYKSFNPHGCDTTLYTSAFVSVHGLYLIVLSTFASILIIWGVFALIKNTLGYLLNLLFSAETRHDAYAWCARTFTQTCNDTCGCYYQPLSQQQLPMPIVTEVPITTVPDEVKLEICEESSA